MSEKKCRAKAIKDTRWDRIRKRYLNNNPHKLKSEAVQRLIELDYIGKHNERLLIEGDAEPSLKLSPSIIMDMRHEMFQQIPRKLPLATVANCKNLDATKAHNLEVEQRYVKHELMKFRQHLAKKCQQRNQQFRVRPTKPDFKLNNQPLMQSLTKAAQHIDEFYTVPVQALNESVQLCATHKQTATNTLLQELDVGKVAEADQEVDECLLQAKEEAVVHKVNIVSEFATVASPDTLEYRRFAKQVQVDENKALLERCRTPSPLTATDEFLKPMRAAAERQMLHLRTVRREEELAEQATHKRGRESSSESDTSDDIDSVISELAEEALYELQMEAVEEQQEQADSHLTKLNQTSNEPDTATPTKHVQFKLVQETEKKPPTPIEKLQPLLIRRIEIPKVLVKPKEVVLEEASISSEEEQDNAHQDEKQSTIDQLFEDRSSTDLAQVRKCFLKWIHYTTIEKIEREHGRMKCDRVQKINAFLDKVRQEKKRIKTAKQEASAHDQVQKSVEDRQGTVMMTKQFRNKIKMQQDVIELQRIKLERQERMIMQLKLNKLSSEANEARENLKQELKTVIRCGDPKSKAKAKCLQLIGSLRDAEDETLARLQGKALLQPRFLQHMQERALERSVRHEQARQRRAQAEAEREAAKLASEEAKRLEDEEAKRLRIELLKEKRRQEKMAKVLKERERQRYIENQRKATEFSRRLILRRVGMEAFKRLLHRKRENLVKSEEFRRLLYKRQCFSSWRDYTAYLQREKLMKAEKFHERILKRQAFVAWYQYAKMEQSKMLVAIDWYELHATDRIFKRWHKYTEHCRKVENVKMQNAIAHHNWHLVWKAFDCWRHLPQILRLERESDERRQRWRMKIWELLPDYEPRNRLW